MVPAGRALTGSLAPSWDQAPPLSREQHQLGAAEIPEVDADVKVRPLRPAPCTAGPTHWLPVSWVEVRATWDDWSLE